MLNTVMVTVIILGAALVVIGTLLPLVPSHAWWVRGWDFPRVQLLILGVAILVIGVLASFPGKLVVLGVVLVACVYQAVRIVPYTPLYPKEMKLVDDVASGSQIVLLSSNVEMPNDRHDAVAELIETVDADIVFLMETDQTWYDSLEPKLSAYPTVVTELRDNYYGAIFATRLKVNEARFVYLSHDDTPTLFAELETQDGHTFRFVGLHPRPPVPGNTTRDRDAEIIYSARFARKTGLPLIAVGDFNDAAWSDTSRRFKRVGGYVDPRVGRGLIASFDAQSRLVRVPIDQFYATPDIAVASFARGPNIGSDHFPLIARIDLDEDKARAANNPPAPLNPDEIEELDRIAAEYRADLKDPNLPKPGFPDEN